MSNPQGNSLATPDSRGWDIAAHIVARQQHGHNLLVQLRQRSLQIGPTRSQHIAVARPEQSPITHTHTVKCENARVRASNPRLFSHVEVVEVVEVVLVVLEVEVVLVVVLVVVLRSVTQRLTLSKAGLAPAPLKRSATRTRWPR